MGKWRGNGNRFWNNAEDNLSRKNQLLLIFLVGILLLIVAIACYTKKDSKAEKTIQETSSVRNVQTNLENYEEYLERRLTKCPVNQ